MHVLLEKLNNLLKEEKWTRTAITEFSTNMFKTYDKEIEEINNSNIASEAESFLDNYIKSNQNSITALYFISMLHAKSKSIEGADYAKKLIDIFEENHRTAITKTVCEKIIAEVDFYRPILTKYIQILEDEKKDNEVIPYMEMLLRIDYSDTKIGKRLANYFEKKGHKDKSIFYYKKVLDHSLNKKNIQEVEELWKKLLDFEQIDYDYFAFKLNAVENINNKVKLGEKMFEHFQNQQKFDLVIKTIKLILVLVSNDKIKSQVSSKFRELIIDSYTKIYGNYSQFEACIRRSNITQNWKNLNQAIIEFEKYIPFDKHKYVYHSISGLGYIKDIKEDYLIIDFDKKKDHRMSIDMAIKSLRILSDDDFIILEHKNPGKLKELLEKKPLELVKLALKSLGNEAITKDIKSLLTRFLINEKDWSKYWDDVRSKIKNDPFIIRSYEKANCYILRDKPISLEESVIDSFKATDKLIDKTKIFYNYLKEGGDPQSEIATGMLKTFIAYIKGIVTIHQNTVIAYFFLRDLKNAYPQLKIDLGFSTEELFNKLKEEGNFIFDLNESNVEKKFFTEMQKQVENWHEIMAEYLLKYPSKYIITTLLMRQYDDLINQKVKELLRNFRDKLDVFLWFTKNVFLSAEYSQIMAEPADVLLVLATSLDYINKALQQKIDVVENRRLFNAIGDILFKEKNLDRYISNKPNISVVEKIASIIFKSKGMKHDYIVEFKTILAKYSPEVLNAIKFKEKDENENKFYVTEKAIKDKQEYLQNLVKVEISRVNNEMALAKEKGDLRENAEYHSAREKLQSLNIEAAELQKEINNSLPIDFGKVTENNVIVGSRVYLKDIENSNEVAYSILGKWDINLEKNVISYETELGKILLNEKVGSIITNTIDNKKYKIIKIEKALK